MTEREAFELMLTAHAAEERVRAGVQEWFREAGFQATPWWVELEVGAATIVASAGLGARWSVRLSVVPGSAVAHLCSAAGLVFYATASGRTAVEALRALTAKPEFPRGFTTVHVSGTEPR
jgi:hypothetical protein